jgi:hypothetical protein
MNLKVQSYQVQKSAQELFDLLTDVKKALVENTN